MENRKAVMWSAIAAFLAVISFWMFVKKSVDNRIGNLDQKKTIYVARVIIPANMRIDESMIRPKEFPAAFLPPRVALSPREVVGQVAVASIFEDEPILTSKIVPFDETSLDRRIPEGYRAVTIGIRDDQDVIGVGGHIRPGHYVDVLVTLYVSTRELERTSPLPAVGQNRDLRAETRTVFQNVKVLAVGRDARLQTANVNRLDDPEFDRANKNVTVALKPADVQALVLAQAIGRITLSLRRFNDTEMVALDYLDPYKAFGIKLPVVSGPAPAYREIRGGQVFATPY